ncbi:MAG: glycosyltransferase [Armatimonadetes bacterium]|jgi:GT2 family glycosyltransferase|nr:glycosyltransferase [Armatimonadota bacterium]
MRLSVAIVNWNTTDLLAACVRSILTFPPKGDYEIIVVDNDSKDFDEQQFHAEFPNVQLICNAENAGYARGNNQALDLARGDYVLLLNPDTEITANALDTLVEFMDDHPNAGAAGAKLLRPDGAIDRSLRSFPYPGPIAWEYLGLARIFPRSRFFGAYRMTWFDYDEIIEVDQPMGSALIINVKALKEIGTLDESFPIFFNEVDWLYRTKQAGWNIYFVPDAVVIHHGGSSTKQVRRRAMVRESHRSLLKFYAKHFKGRICPLTYYFTVACIRISMCLRG